ncbi:MAG: hypothetical protein H6828_12285 [Planctomycetes bacterium]|nr:hypothetical protein [Planctomycetota bacterium]
MRHPQHLRGLALALLVASCGGGGGGGTASPPGDTGGPDLFVQSLDVTPTDVEVGQPLHVVDVVANAGDSAASAFQVSIYLSPDPFVNSADVLLGVRNLGVLAPSATSSGGGFLTVPGNVTAGTWYVGAVADSGGAVTETDEANNALVAAAPVTVHAVALPDLAPSTLSYSPTTVEAGQQITVTDTVANHGTGAAGAFQVGLYLSHDPQITSGDTLIGLRNVPGLGPGELSFASSPVTVPASLAAGDWFVGVIADVGGARVESDEFNNSLSSITPLHVTHPPRPDLLVTQLAFSPSQLDAGQSLSVSETAANQGLVAAGPFRVGIYLSADDEVTVDDRLIGFRAVAGLQVGETSAASAPLVVPSDTPGGTYHLGAIVDYEAGVLEENEDNNATVALGLVEVFVPPMPDLQPVAVSFGPSALQAGEALTVVERVKNHGVVAASNVRVAVYLSSNPVVSTSDTLLGVRTIPSLAPGEQSEAQSVFTLPLGLGTGSWTLGVIADDLDAVAEPNESDNLLVAPGHVDVTGSSQPMADLHLSVLSSSPSQVIPGHQLTIAHTVRNDGDLSAPGFVIEFYLSDDDVIDATDHLIGVRTLFGLGIGQGSAQSFPYTVPAGLPVGVYRLGAIVDAAGAVAESDESNNVKLATGTVTLYVPPPPAPDLIVTALTFGPTPVAAGGTLTLDDVVRNQGDLTADACHVSYYLSVDDQVATDDVWLGDGLALPALAAGAQSPSSNQFNLPAGLAAGTWHVGAIVTLDAGTAESDTANNTFVATATLEVTP